MDRRRGLTLVAGVAIAAHFVTRRYREDVAEANARLEAVDRNVIQTGSGALEWAERGEGPAVLVSHGLLHGCDAGLTSVRDMVAGRRVIAPSRFGYLGSTLGDDASSATQADAFVDLLDHLGLDEVDVIGISAGTGAALQMAARHPDRVGNLVISSGNLPGNPTAAAPPDWAKVFYDDRVMWTLKTVSRSMLGRMMGAPAGFPQNDEQAEVIREMVNSIFPIAPRRAGALFDLFVSNPEVDTVRLEAIEVPTLIVHARDDPLTSYDAAERAADRILGAVLVSLESGGHLHLGQTDRVGQEIAAFLETPSRAAPV